MKITPLVPFLTAFAFARAATLDVTTTADTGAGSLRAQVAAALTGDTVSISTTGTIALTSGQIVIDSRNLTIAGPGASVLTITTNATTRALKIVNAQCTISGITFANCKGLPGDVDTGGAIAVDNFTSGGTSHVTTITDCAFTNNTSGWGGALDVFQGGLVLQRCTFSGNTCNGVALGTNGGGGALSLGPTVPSTIANCTFSANVQTSTAASQLGGGAVYNYGATFANPPTVTFEHCTFAGNVDTSTAAGAIRGNYTGSYHTAARLKNCLLVGNQAPASVLKNFAGNATGALTASFTSLGGNVTDEAATSAQFMAGNIDRTSLATLGASVSPTLALNGGATKTHAIARGSAAQRSGRPSAVLTDQRGAPRHASADAGAFELIEPELVISVEGSVVGEGGELAFASTPFDSPLTKTLTITNTQTSAFTSGPLVLGGVALPQGFSASGFPTAPLGNGQSATFNVTLLSSNAGLYSAPLTFTGNDTFTPALALATAGAPNLHTLNLAGLITDTADHWRQQFFGAGATNSGAAADDASPAGDGIANLLKYSFGLNPFVAYPPGAGTNAALDANGHLTLAVTKNPAATDVALAIEVSGDLTSPESWTSSDVTLDEDTATTVRGHDRTPVGSAPGRFIRVRATRP